MDNNAPKDGIPLEEDDDMCLDLLENTNLFKFNFMKKFAAKTGLLSSLELEELLTQKIAESIKFHTDNADLRERLERHEKINKSNMKRLSIITKQYQNFRMTHNRLVRDLIDLPDAAIVPVKITRDVGLQVYQHAVCSKNVTTPQPAPQHTRIVKKGPALVQRRKPMTGNPPNSNRNMLRITATTNGPEPSTSSNGNTTVPQETPPSFAVWIREGQIPDPQETEIAVVMKPTIAAANRTLDTAPNVVVQCNHTSEANSVVAPHPAPLPLTPPQQITPGQKTIAPRPIMKVHKVQAGIIVSWKIEQLTDKHADIHSYQIYAYEENSDPSSSDSWESVGIVNPLPFPMAVTLTQFQDGRKYFFAVRAVDIHMRPGPFSLPQTWLENF